MKKRFMIILIVLLAFLLTGCSSQHDEIISDNKDDIFIINLSGNLDKQLQACEITEDINCESDKQYKFIVLNEDYINTLTDYSEIYGFKQKILSGYNAVYPQTDKEKASKFIKLMGGRRITEDGDLCGVIMERDMNFTTNSYYTQTVPCFVIGEPTGALEFIKSEIKATIILILNTR